VAARGDGTALLVIDMLNTYEHEDADKLAESVAEAVLLRRRWRLETNMRAEITTADGLF
jgi:hypothetical protein